MLPMRLPIVDHIHRNALIFKKFLLSVANFILNNIKIEFYLNICSICSETFFINFGSHKTMNHMFHNIKDIVTTCNHRENVILWERETKKSELCFLRWRCKFKRVLLCKWWNDCILFYSPIYLRFHWANNNALLWNCENLIQPIFFHVTRNTNFKCWLCVK